MRSSATAEDLPTARFAGQHESFLNVRGEAGLIEACRRYFASIFTERATGYRLDNGFDHFKVALSVAMMQMVRWVIGASGDLFILDTDTGFPDVVFVTGGYGLGEIIVQGAIEPDEFHVHKPRCRQGFRAVLRRRLGAAQLPMVYAHGAGCAGGGRTWPTSRAERARFCLSDADVLILAGGNRHRGSLFVQGRPAHADGYRMDPGRLGRGALHRPGAAGDDGLAPLGDEPQVLCHEGIGAGARACRHLSQMAAAARYTAARKFRAVLS